MIFNYHLFNFIRLIEKKNISRMVKKLFHKEKKVYIYGGKKLLWKNAG